MFFVVWKVKAFYVRVSWIFLKIKLQPIVQGPLYDLCSSCLFANYFCSHCKSRKTQIKHKVVPKVCTATTLQRVEFIHRSIFTCLHLTPAKILLCKEINILSAKPYALCKIVWENQTKNQQAYSCESNIMSDKYFQDWW